jgi:hypothetical protein
VQLGDRDIAGCKLGISNMYTQNQIEIRGSASLGHLSMTVPRGSTPLVHLTRVGPIHLTDGTHLCHMAAPHWATSVTVNRLLDLEERVLLNGPITICHLSLILCVDD